MREVTHQGLLLPALQKIFPGEEISINTRKNTSIKDPVTGRFLELDLWIPNYNICFEFQDSYHYITTWYSHIPLNQTHYRDKETRKKEETLVVVPCWWDGAVESLLASILFQRPDLKHNVGVPLPSFRSPVSLNLPLKQFSSNSIPDIGELMLASFPLATKFLESISHTNNWWLGEKYDGVRCCWHPTMEKLSGLEFELTDSLLNQMPDIFLDAEIWFGRGQFQHSQQFVQSDIEYMDTQFLRVLAFDEPPHVTTNNAPFEIRYKNILSNLAYNHPLVCVSEKMAKTMMTNVLDTGGEGIILRKPSSLYIHGRTSSLVKLKASRADMEGIVIMIGEDKSVVLKLADESTIVVERQNILIPETLQKGDIVTFSYDNYSRNSQPVNSRIIRIRCDITWDDVLSFHASDELQLENEQFTAHPLGYWTSDKGRNMRIFLENVAWKMDKDPLVAETWYSIPRSVIEGTKGGRSIMNHFKGGYVNALVQLFPEVQFDENKFDMSYNLIHYSKDVNRRRNWFIKFAQEKKFDPFVADNWYNIASERFLKKAQKVLNYYSGNFVKALSHLFPEIGFDESRFFPVNKWQNEDNRREFLKNFARLEGFDYSIPDHWYPISISSVISHKGGQGVLYHYDFNLARAVIELFPDIHFDYSKFTSTKGRDWRRKAKQILGQFATERGFEPSDLDFWHSHQAQNFLLEEGKEIMDMYQNSISAAISELFPISTDESIRIHVPQNHWRDKTNRRKFFENFARAKGFDPLVATNWYSHAGEIKGASGILAYYANKSVPSALLELFPNIGLERDKFNTHKHWHDLRNRKLFFENFANQNNFDAQLSSNWTNQRKALVCKQQGAKGVLHYYGGNVTKALSHLFPDIGLKLPTLGQHWLNKGVRKQILLMMAKAHNIDPLQSDQWRLNNDAVLNSKGGKELLSFYNGSIESALQDLFPSSLYSIKGPRKQYWKDPANVRTIMETVAKNNNFNPNSPHEWYSLTNDILTQQVKGLKSMSSVYNGSTAQMIVEAFPSLHLKKDKFLFIK